MTGSAVPEGEIVIPGKFVSAPWPCDAANAKTPPGLIFGQHIPYIGFSRCPFLPTHFTAFHNRIARKDKLDGNYISGHSGFVVFSYHLSKSRAIAKQTSVNDMGEEVQHSGECRRALICERSSPQVRNARNSNTTPNTVSG
jgi:hypothetical protein